MLYDDETIKEIIDDVFDRMRYLYEHENLSIDFIDEELLKIEFDIGIIKSYFKAKNVNSAIKELPK